MRWNKSTLVEQGAAAAVRKLRVSPATLWMLPSTWQIFSKIIYLSTLHALKREKFTKSCTPSRWWFRGVTGLNVSTISAITTRLAKDGWISKFQRRPIMEKYQTCLYRLEGVTWDRVKEIIIEFMHRLNRVAYVRDLVSKDGVSIHLKRKKSDFSYKLKTKEWTDIQKSFYDRHPELV